MEINEDNVVATTVTWLEKQGWQLCFRTRPVAEGAIGGVDAILLREKPLRFAFVDGKGDTPSATKRSRGFTSALGALIKRIRFERGYLGNEARSCFQALPGRTVPELRELLQRAAIHRRSEYFLALPESYEQTVYECLDPALAALLNVRVVFVGPDAIVKFPERAAG